MMSCLEEAGRLSAVQVSSIDPQMLLRFLLVLLFTVACALILG